MKNEFVPYQQTTELKQLGFDKPCFAIYEDKKWQLVEVQNSISYELCLKTDTFPVPTFSQVFRWFREKYWLDNAVLKDRYVIETREDLPIWYYGFNTYEEAELACLEKLIEIVKTN